MTVPTLRPVRPPAFERLQQDLRLPFGDDFTACRQLVAMIEAIAPLMSELDRQQLGRLMTAAGHQIGLSCGGRIVRG